MAAERLLQETKDLISDVRVRARQHEREVGTRFQQRVGDIDFWKSELAAKLTDLKDAVETCESTRVRVDQALAACSPALAAVEECLAHRGQRQGNDRIDDNVHKHLVLEADTVKNAQVLLRQTHMQIAEEIRLLQKGSRPALANDSVFRFFPNDQKTQSKLLSNAKTKSMTIVKICLADHPVFQSSSRWRRTFRTRRRPSTSTRRRRRCA